MGRGQNAPKATDATANRRAPLAVVDPAPDQEHWHLLPGAKDIYVSVEAAPEHYQTSSSWEYQAIVIQVGTRFAKGYKVLAETTGDNPQSTTWEAVKPLVEDKRRHLILSEKQMDRLLKTPADPVDFINEPGRIKSVPEPVERQRLSLDVSFTREEEPVPEGETEYQAEVFFNYQLGGYSKEGRGFDTERIAANFDTEPEEIFVVTKTHSEADTFGGSRGMKDFYFAFDSDEAAQEYLDYLHSHKPRFQFWGYSESYDIERFSRNA